MVIFALDDSRVGDLSSRIWDMYAVRRRDSDFRLCMCYMCWFGLDFVWITSHRDWQDTGRILLIGMQLRALCIYNLCRQCSFVHDFCHFRMEKGLTMRGVLRSSGRSH